MPHYEYKAIPAPAKGEKAKGVRTPEGRFAQAIENVLNRYGESGWEYVRAELLPNQERSGLTGSTTEWRTLLIFRRAQESDEEVISPRVLDSPGVIPEESAGARLAMGAQRDAEPEESNAPAVVATQPDDDPANETVVPYPTLTAVEPDKEDDPAKDR